MNIPFSKISLSGNETKYLDEVLRSGWLTTSSKVFKFEELFAGFIGAKYACAVNSCTAALHLSLEASGINKGDKVLVPSLTFTASAEVIRYMGADPVFTDVDYDTCLVTPEIVEHAIRTNKGIKAIIVVHYGGQSPILTTPDGKGIIDICRRNNITVIEDAAHAFPTKFDGKYIGTFGDVTCFSFYANKTITTGEGGMVITDSEAIYNRVKLMRLHGITRDIWDRFTSITPAWEYDVVAPGYKYNMPDINAAIGLAQLEKAAFFRDQRQRCAAFYYENLNDTKGIDLPRCQGLMSDHSWHLFPIKLTQKANLNRDEFITQMNKAGIGTSVHYKPLHRMTYYKEKYKLNPQDYPNTERIWEGTVSLPIYPSLTEDELNLICQTIRRVIVFGQ